MALATRCPNCQAMFRVVADQLKLRGGLVRCGTCRHVFDAIGSLVYVDDATVRSAPIPAQSTDASQRKSEAAANAQSTKRVAPKEKAVDTKPITLRITPNTVMQTLREQTVYPEHFVPRSSDSTRPEHLGVPTLLGIGGIGTDALDARSIPGEPVVRDNPKQRAGTEHKAPLPQPVAPPKPEPSARPAKKAEPKALPKKEQAVPHNHTAPLIESVETQPDTPTIAPNETPSFLDRPKRFGRRFALYALGSAALSMVIAVQLTVLFRSDVLALWSGARPTLVTLCKWFDCQVQWPARANMLAVLGTELQAIPGTEALELTAVIRNRAQYRVGLPALEVTLTDTQNRPLARKVFLPADYLASSGERSSKLEEGFAAGDDYTIRVVFEARGLSAVGFLVYPFYP